MLVLGGAVEDPIHPVASGLAAGLGGMTRGQFDHHRKP